MTLSTSTKKGKPSSRIVLLKQWNEEGFIFYTNYKSRKGKELFINPHATILFYWQILFRQIRIEGTLRKVTKKNSEEYFHTRPYESQIGAWASHQSEVIENREALEKKFKEMKERFSKGNVPLPPYWGGYILNPNRFEFWQGQNNRLHDRILFTRSKNNWNIARLSP